MIRARTLHTGLLLLLAAVLSLAPLAPRAEEEPPADLDKLNAEFEKAYGAEDYAKALEIAEKTTDVTWPRHLAALYNVAAMHCRLGHKEKAYEWLRYTLDAGWWDYRKLRGDEDFDCIRNEDKFKRMVRGAWAKQYISMLERPERDEFQQPDRVMKTLAFKDGERVADLGAGSGYFTVRVARAVGSDGVVWAKDLRQEMLDYLAERLEEEQVDNVKLELVPEDDPLLAEGSVDTILMVDVWHYIRDPEYAKKLRRGLAPGGRLVVIDYRPKPWEERPWGPPPAQQTPREELDAHMAEAGLRPVRVHDFLSEQYFVEYAAE